MTSPADCGAFEPGSHCALPLPKKPVETYESSPVPTPASERGVEASEPTVVDVETELLELVGRQIGKRLSGLAFSCAELDSASSKPGAEIG